jgi:flagellum-specific peptidoglycan hydrolase FlgJ
MTAQQVNFVNVLYPPALELEKNNQGAPALFVLAQSALETGWGKSAPQNMYFGVKATPAWRGRRQYLRTFEIYNGTPPRLNSMNQPIEIISRKGNRYVIMDWFRAYNTPIESLRDHLALMKTKRYIGAFTHRASPEKFAEFVAKAGYATAENYLPSLLKTIQMIRNIVGKVSTGNNFVLPVLLLFAVTTVLILK